MTRRSGSTNANPFPLPTGTSRKKRRSGGRHGRNFASDKPEVAAVKGAYLQTAKLVERGTGEHRAAHPCRLHSKHFVTQGVAGKTGIFPISV